MSSGGDFWSSRRAAVKAEEDAAVLAEAQCRDEKELAENEAREDAEILAELDLPDPDELKLGDDIRGFMSRSVPDRLRRRALRRLWTLNPVLANVDGLVDYGEDFTDSATVVENLQTAYQVGKGMLSHVEEMVRQAEKAPPDTDFPDTADDQDTANPEDETTPENTQPVDVAIDIDHDIEETVLPTPRRMRFEFDLETQSSGMTETAEISQLVPSEDRMRADLYNLLGLTLAAAPDQLGLDQISGPTGDESDLGQAIQGMVRVARITKPAAAEREFNALFIGLGRGELLPYASYYLTGFLNEKPLAQLRSDMAARGITRAPNVYEPEDNIASLMEMMGGMIAGRFGKPATLADQKLFWNRHVGPWAGHFFTDLEAAENSVLYASVGNAGRIFMEIERDGFRMTAN